MWKLIYIYSYNFTDKFWLLLNEQLLKPVCLLYNCRLWLAVNTDTDQFHASYQSLSLSYCSLNLYTTRKAWQYLRNGSSKMITRYPLNMSFSQSPHTILIIMTQNPSLDRSMMLTFCLGISLKLGYCSCYAVQRCKPRRMGTSVQSRSTNSSSQVRECFVSLSG